MSYEASSQGFIGEFIDIPRWRTVMLATMASVAICGAPAEARTPDSLAPIADPVEHSDIPQAQTTADTKKPVFTAGEGMTQPYLTELNRVVSNYFLPVPKNQIVVTLGKTRKYCKDAASPTRALPSLSMCIEPAANKMHMQRVPLWQVARLVAHELEGHDLPDAIVEEERRNYTSTYHQKNTRTRHQPYERQRPRGPSKLFVNFFITAGMASNRKEAVEIIRSGPLDQKVAKDMRSKGKYADEALAEVAGSCAQAGFYLEPGSTFTSWLSNDAKVQLSDTDYTAACTYLFEEYSKYPHLTLPAGKISKNVLPGVNYYDSMFCSSQTQNSAYVWPQQNYAWPQWERACRDSR